MKELVEERTSNNQIKRSHLRYNLQVYIAFLSDD